MGCSDWLFGEDLELSQSRHSELLKAAGCYGIMEKSSENSCLGDLPRLKFPRHTRQGGKEKKEKAPSHGGLRAENTQVFGEETLLSVVPTCGSGSREETFPQKNPADLSSPGSAVVQLRQMSAWKEIEK